ncbi:MULTISPECIES: hypothetical protein [unclassified Devosia]|uniref:hypothetical protein n=1 Tax=unclassified Devosia TaxID=196773 RepID=UPI00145F5DB4|nr:MULTISPECIES: hypothetical protein [unclassified Devosia]MBJ6986163.1 hypothetical protein [Devosia sp. MC521]QMW64349.1 hypothetical protein H4N61_08640 [Devosia sp. MC521]
MYATTPFYASLTNGDFPVIVSLARHDIDLAKAALDAGATAIKTHLNAYHRATDRTFGTFAQERPFFEELAKLGCPLLVMAGQEIVPSEAEMDALYDLGFQGFNVYVDHLQPHLLKSKLRPMPALASTSTPEDLQRIAAIPGCIIEASIMTFDRYRTAMTEDDLARYKAIVDAVDVPVILPSQLALTPADARRLREIGIAAPLLGAIVTGDTAESMFKAVSGIVSA